MAELALLQSELLGRAAKAVKPGGRLIYAVCTLARSETLGVAAAFEKACPEFERVPIANPLEPEATPEAELFLRPERWKGNGMFVAV